MDPSSTEHIVREFWRLMATNEFSAVAAVLAHDFVLEWPQSNERIRGAVNFARLNHEYPAAGPWQFTVNRIVAGASDAVSDVTVSDGLQTARAVSFFTVRDSRIAKIVEYWPEPYQPPFDRAHLTEPLEQASTERSCT